MSGLAPPVGALALTAGVAAVARTPEQISAERPLGAQQVHLIADASASRSDVTNCGPRETIVAQLGELFQEAQSGMGIVDTSAVVEVFVSEAGTFTILASGTDGTSCILASGEGWDGAKQVAGAGA